MTKKTGLILIISFIVITMCGIGLGTWNFISQHAYINEKTVVLEDELQEEFAISLEGLAPGMKTAYAIHLKGNRGDAFDVVAAFEQNGEDSLAAFVDVEIFVDGESVGKASLAKCLAGEVIAFDADFDKGRTVEVEIVYSMGLDVGDEAQDTSADFHLVLTSTR